MSAARYHMISIPEAVDIVLSHTPVLGAETVPLAATLGRVLADDITASDALPPFPASIMVSALCSTVRQRASNVAVRRKSVLGHSCHDRRRSRRRQPVAFTAPASALRPSTQDGYAVVSSDGAGEFPVVAECRAGDAGDFNLAPGQVSYITTGVANAAHLAHVAAADNIAADTIAAGMLTLLSHTFGARHQVLQFLVVPTP